MKGYQALGLVHHFAAIKKALTNRIDSFGAIYEILSARHDCIYRPFFVDETTCKCVNHLLSGCGTRSQASIAYAQIQST